MPTTAKTKATKADARKATRAKEAARPATMDAVALLTQDHREVDQMFAEYEELKGGNRAAKKKLAARICQALTVHAQIEEEIFYPAARKATGDEDLLDEALVEHAGVKQLIREIEAMEPGEALYDAKIRVMGEQVRHHVEEEEEELFPEVEKSKLDVAALGEELAGRKEELMSEFMSAAK